MVYGPNNSAAAGLIAVIRGTASCNNRVRGRPREMTPGVGVCLLQNAVDGFHQVRLWYGTDDLLRHLAAFE